MLTEEESQEIKEKSSPQFRPKAGVFRGRGRGRGRGRQVLCWLGALSMICWVFDEDIYSTVRRLAAKWCAELSVHGDKKHPWNATFVV